MISVNATTSGRLLVSASNRSRAGGRIPVAIRPTVIALRFRAQRTEVVDQTPSLYGTGRKRVHSNANGGMIHSHRSRKLDQRALGTAVRCVPGRRDATKL